MRRVNVFQKVGTIVFDFLAITVLLTLSLLLVFPFPFIVTGVHNYFLYKVDDRRLANIFNIFGENWKILLKFSLVWGIVLILSVLEIVYFNSVWPGHNFLTLLCYVLLILCIILITNAPMIIIRMRVTLPQLLFNSITLIYGCWWFLLIAYIATIGYCVAFSFFPYISGAGLYFLALIDNLAARRAIRKLMAKAKKVPLSEIVEPENMDITDK